MRVFDAEGLHLDFRMALGGLHQSGGGFRLVVLNADDGLVGARCDEGGLDADDTLLGVLNGHTVVGGDVRLALGGVDDEVLAFLFGLEHVFDVGGEAGAAESHNALVLHAGDDFVLAELDLAHDVRGCVNILHPFVTLAVDDDGGLLITADVGNHVHAVHGSGDGGVDVGAHEAAGLSNELSHFHFVAFLYDGLRRSTEVLRHIYHSLIGEWELFNTLVVSNLVGFGMYTSHVEGFLSQGFHFFFSFG